MAVAGLIVGWRIRTSFLDAVLGFVVLLLFAYAVSWVMAWVGLLVRTPEIVNNAAFIVIFPVTLIANTFVPSNTLPGPLKAFANWNPVSSVTQAAREQFGNTEPGAACRRRVADAAPGAVLLDLGGADPRGLHPSVDPPVPQGRQPLTGGPLRSKERS